MKKFKEYNNSYITKAQLIDYLGGSNIGTEYHEEDQPDPIDILLDLLNPEEPCYRTHKGWRRAILEWTYEGDDYGKYIRHNSKGEIR